jgi:hypothetical protein
VSVGRVVVVGGGQCDRARSWAHVACLRGCVRHGVVHLLVVPDAPLALWETG